MSSNAVEMENITLHFPKQTNAVKLIINLLKRKKERFTALRNVTLNVRKGEVLGVIGKNGSGKSTLLRIISGIYPADEGICKVSGSVSLLAGLGTGFSGHQTGRENAILYGSDVVLRN